MKQRIDNWLEKHLGGHVSFWCITIHGFNAMHVSISVRSRWGYVCFHPTIHFLGRWWPWKLYVSPNATPWAATFVAGPGIDWVEKLMAPIRRRLFGHNFGTGSEFIEWNRNLRDHLELLHHLNHQPAARLAAELEQ